MSRRHSGSLPSRGVRSYTVLFALLTNACDISWAELSAETFVSLQHAYYPCNTYIAILVPPSWHTFPKPQKWTSVAVYKLIHPT